jgi:hypothetical protein
MSAPRQPAPPKPEAEGKFDKFAAFGLVLPATLLAIITLIVAMGYTVYAFDVGFPGKTVANWNTGSEAVTKLSGAVQISGFSQSGYIGDSSSGEMDVALLNVGRNHNVNLGDVFTLTTETPDVRIEFVVFDVQAETSQAYILLGENVAEGGKRKYGFKLSALCELCGGTNNIAVQRLWKDQIVRRYAEPRSGS